MKSIRVEEIVKALNGVLLSGTQEQIITSVTTDSRKVSSGCLFVALTSGTRDGHGFLTGAAGSGAEALLVSDETYANDIIKAGKIAVIKVPDTLVGLQMLAKYYLSTFEDLIKIAVTGSNGKTSTKEMIHAVMEQKYKTAKNMGNFNNHIGVPLTAFTVEEMHQAVVFEMGMSDLKEIQLLAEIVRPQTAAITNIGVSHIDRLKTKENILKAKSEIYTFFDATNLLVINGDDEMLVASVKDQTKFPVIQTGTRDHCQLKIQDLKDLGGDGITFTLVEDETMQPVTITYPGVHNAWNAAIAAAIGKHYGISLKEAAKGLYESKLADKRLEVIEANGVRIIDDTYNANIDSMKAGIDVLMATKGNRKVAILGDMLGSGEFSDLHHYEVGKYALNKATDVIISVGERAAKLHEGASQGKKNITLYFKDKEDLLPQLETLIQHGDIVLVKGSRGMKMEEITRKLTEIRSR